MFRHRRDPMVVDGHDTNSGRRATMTTDTTAARRTTRPALRGTSLVIAAAAVLALGLWAIARFLGVDLTVGEGHAARQVGAIDVLLATAVAGLAARAVHLVLIRRRRTARWWPFVGSTALAISVIGPSYLADGAAAVVLIGMHLVVGAVVIVGFARYAPGPG
jgi:hypothetical protein